MTAQEDVEQIRNIIETGEAFRSLCAQIDNLQAEKEQCEAEIANLCLTSFRDTFSIVDLGKARAHFAKRMEDPSKGYKKLVAQKYEASVGGGQSGARALDSVYNALCDELHNKYDSVDWSEPFDFIIQPEALCSLYRDMASLSLPCVNVSKDKAALFGKRQVFVFATSKEHVFRGLPDMQMSYQAMHAAMIKDKVCTSQVSAIPESSIDLLLKNAGKQGVDDPDGVKCLAEGVPYQIGSDVEFVPDYDAEVEDIEEEDVSEDQPEIPENE